MTKNNNCRINQEPGPSSQDTQVKAGKYVDSDNTSLEIENYIQDEIDAQIAEYDTLNSLEDIYTSLIIDVDDFNFELACELKKRLIQLNYGAHHSDKSDNSATLHKYEYWIRILKQIDGFITSQELDVLDKCISTYASVCSCPYERRKEIFRSIFLFNGWSGINHINLLEFESKISQIDVQILFELTEILLEFEYHFYFSLNPENSLQIPSAKNDWPISTFYYHWEKSDIDCTQWYEIHTELCWVANGLIQDFWEADRVIYFAFSTGSYQPEYDYYVNQFMDNEPSNTEGYDLGGIECLIEDDLFKDTWLVAGMEFPNSIDYFWEAEITEFCQNKDGGFHTEYRDYFSEHEYDHYSKFRCIQGDSGFYFCSKESCEGCKYFGGKKLLNQQYVLWQKYVQTIELE